MQVRISLEETYSAPAATYVTVVPLDPQADSFGPDIRAAVIQAANGLLRSIGENIAKPISETEL